MVAGGIPVTPGAGLAQISMTFTIEPGKPNHKVTKTRRRLKTNLLFLCALVVHSLSIAVNAFPETALRTTQRSVGFTTH
jgi:hypothetical protein